MSVTLHTNKGDLKMEIYCEDVPKTAENFLALCASEYYNASPIHRMIPGFLFQAGRPAHPTPDAPKAGRSIFGPTFADEIRPHLRHDRRGVVSMVNRGPDTNGSQFFVLLDRAPHLDGLNTVFGRVLVDRDDPQRQDDASARTMAKIEAVGAGPKDRPLEALRIDSVTIHANPLAG